MRTWLLFTANAGPSGEGVQRRHDPHDKKRVPAPVCAGSPYALARKDGPPAGLLPAGLRAP
jgi:hypothetical protein